MTAGAAVEAADAASNAATNPATAAATNVATSVATSVATPAVVDAAAEMPFDVAEFLKHCPSLPGVYRHLNAVGDVLYVGKARDLKKRVSTYFQKGHNGPRIAHMVSQVARVEVTVTRSESEALLLENNLIKELAPRYNILFRDDKSYPYVMITGHAAPQIRFYRGAIDKRNQYFGPFPNSNAVRDSLHILQKVFRLRTCDDGVFANRSRPCLLHQIERCTAPCVQLISKEDYTRDVRDATRFLSGRSQELLEELQVEMMRKSDALQFEEAAKIRDRIGALSHVLQAQGAEAANETDVDIVACVVGQGMACVSLAMVRGGRHLGDKQLFPQHVDDATAADVLVAFIVQHYPGRFTPPSIVINHDLPDVEELAEALSGDAGRRVNVIRFPQEQRRLWLTMAEKNAQIALERVLAERGTAHARTRLLAGLLNMD